MPQMLLKTAVSRGFFMKIIIDEFSKSQWKDYACNFADHNIYQTWAYQQVRAENESQQLSRAVVLDDNDNVLTMCQVRIKKVSTLGLRIGYIQGGPLFCHKDGKVRCTAEDLMKLSRVYLLNRVDVLRLVPHVFNGEIGQPISTMLKAAGFQYIATAKPYRTFVLPVEKGEAEIRKRLHKSFRRDLKYAERAGIRIREGGKKELFEIMEKLDVISKKRKGYKGIDPKIYKKTQDLLLDDEKLKVILAYYDREPVSTLLISNLGEVGLVLLSASSKKGLAVRASYLTWYKGAVTTSRAGMKQYDLGGIDPVNNPTVRQFKSRMGGTECYHIGLFVAYKNYFVKKLWQIAEKAYHLAKK
jgi:lipid II:glycine glycyltransferase (peptidoglycan interpeptide bridge formation enzyme)